MAVSQKCHRFSRHSVPARLLKVVSDRVLNSRIVPGRRYTSRRTPGDREAWAQEKAELQALAAVLLYRSRSRLVSVATDNQGIPLARSGCCKVAIDEAAGPYAKGVPARLNSADCAPRSTYRPPPDVCAWTTRIGSPPCEVAAAHHGTSFSVKEAFRPPLRKYLTTRPFGPNAHGASSREPSISRRGGAESCRNRNTSGTQSGRRLREVLSRSRE